MLCHKSFISTCRPIKNTSVLQYSLSNGPVIVTFLKKPIGCEYCETVIKYSLLFDRLQLFRSIGMIITIECFEFFKKENI